MRRLTMITWLLLAALPACQSGPGHYGGPAHLQRNLTKLLDRLHPRHLLDGAVRGLERARATSVALLDRDIQRGQRLPQTGLRPITTLRQKASATPLRMARAATRYLDQRVRALARLTQPDSLPRKTLSVNQANRRIRHLVAQAPRVLGLDRQILPSPSDPSRQTQFGVTVVRESWLERLARRVGL